jgi:hypothetical protein
VGTNSSTYTNAGLANGDIVTCTLTSDINCPTGNPATSNALTMTVNTNNAVSVSIAANPGTNVCTGTSVTYTATPTNGGTTPVYQWKLNGGNVGTNSSTYTNSVLANADIINCVLTSNVSCPTGNPATSNTVTMSVNPLPTITLGSNPVVCRGVTSANLTYSGTTESPNQYSINYDAIAEAQGFTDVTYVALPSSLIIITVPAGASYGAYNGTLTVRNSSYETCNSPNYSIQVIINGADGGTIADNQFVCNGGDPAILTSTLNGSGSGTITYRWESGTTNCSSGFSTIGGETGTTYDPPSGITQTTYYRRVSISTLNGASCEAISNCVTVTVNTLSVLITAIYGDDECPELNPLKGFNPENGINYSSGSTEVVFRVMIQNSSATSWEFDYEIQGATVHSTSPEDQSGTISGITANNYDLHFHITNDPGNPINVKLLVTEVSDSEGCNDPTDRDETINILPMPALGPFN